MKMHEITHLNESSLVLDKLKKFAKSHYSDTEDEIEALLLLFARSLQHAEADDHRQDAEIQELQQQVSQLTKNPNSGQ